MDWETIQQITSTVQNVAASVAIIIGACWALYRFELFRTRKPRLEFGFEWSRLEIDDSHVLVILTIKLTNTGQTKVDLREDGGNPRSFFKYALISENRSRNDIALLNDLPDGLDHLDTAFIEHGWIEPGETIDEVKVLSINKGNLLAVQFEVEIWGLGLVKWSASTALPLIGAPESKDFTSEDEQGEYEEADAHRAGLKNVLARINRLGENQGDKFKRIVKEIETLLNESDKETFTRQAKQLITKAENELRSIR